ncbi:MAG: toxin-antitoxin system YwqK family antitoxin [Flavobacteriales bacterium]|nr:toxin-antitoxin system YwqK family antitoxin [Flavobacteriales bacterium]
MTTCATRVLRHLAALLLLSATAIPRSSAQSGEPIPLEQTRVANGALWYGSQRATGLVVDMASGPILSECNYVNGVKHGECRTNYPNEKPKLVEHYAQGRLHGVVEVWHANGKVRSRYVYENGKLSDGDHKEFDEHGGTRLEKKVVNGIVVKEARYRDGKLDGHITERFDNGKVGLDATYSAGLRNGSFLHYDREGRDVRLETFVNDSLMRYQTTDYHPTGKIRERTEFDPQGRMQGMAETYWPDGTLKRKSRYNSGSEVEVLVDNNENPDKLVSKVFDPNRHLLLTTKGATGSSAPVVLCEVIPMNAREKGDVELSNKVKEWLPYSRLMAYLGSREVEADYILTMKEVDAQVVYDNGKASNTTKGPLGIIIETNTTTTPGYIGRVFIPMVLTNTRTGAKREAHVGYETQRRSNELEAFNTALYNGDVQSELNRLIGEFFP